MGRLRRVAAILAGAAVLTVLFAAAPSGSPAAPASAQALAPLGEAEGDAYVRQVLRDEGRRMRFRRGAFKFVDCTIAANPYKRVCFAIWVVRRRLLHVGRVTIRVFEFDGVRYFGADYRILRIRVGCARRHGERLGPGRLLRRCGKNLRGPRDRSARPALT